MAGRGRMEDNTTMPTEAVILIDRGVAAMASGQFDSIIRTEWLAACYAKWEILHTNETKF